MRRRLSISAGALVVVVLSYLGLVIAPASAASPHFISASATISPTGALVCSFKEAGLGNTVTSTRISCSADASAVYFCLNNGGQNPDAANKRTISGPLVSAGDFPVRNGQTTGSLSVGPLGPGSFTCPSGQTRTLSSVSYTNITLTGQAGDTATVPGSLSKVFVVIP